MEPLDHPHVVVRQLLSRPDMTENKIVRGLKKLGVRTSQPTINRIKHRPKHPTSFELARGLHRLREQIAQQAQA